MSATSLALTRNGGKSTAAASGGALVGGKHLSAEIVKKQLELVKKIGLGKVVPADLSKKFQEKPRDGVTLKFRVSRIWTNASGDPSIVARVIEPNEEEFKRRDDLHKFYDEKTGDFGVEIDIEASDEIRKRAATWNERRAAGKKSFHKELTDLMANAHTRVVTDPTNGAAAIVEDAMRRRFTANYKNLPQTSQMSEYRNAIEWLVTSYASFRVGVENSSPDIDEEAVRRKFDVNNTRIAQADANDPNVFAYRVAVQERDADVIAEVLAKNEELCALYITELVDKRYGEDIVFPETPRQRYYANKDNWIRPPNKEKCSGIDEVLKISTGYIKISGMRVVYSVSDPNPNSADKKADKKENAKVYVPKHEFPSGVPMIFVNANVIDVDSTPPSTIMRALDMLALMQPNSPHFDTFVPTIWELAEEHSKLTEEEKKSAQRSFFIRISSEKSQRDIALETCRPSGIYTVLSLPTAEKELICGMPGKECAVLSTITAVRQWRDPTPDHSLQFLDENASEGWEWSLHSQIYGGRPGDKTPSKLASCPLQAFTAWQALAPTLCAGLNFYLEFAPDLPKSMMQPYNNDNKAKFEASKTAERLTLPQYNMKTFPRRIVADWVQQLYRNAIPVSMAAAKELLKGAVKNYKFSECASPTNVVVALNETPENVQFKYFAGETRYRYEVLVPITLDEGKREVFNALRAAADDGWTGPLGEVLLDDSYSIDDAESLGAHPAIVEARMSRLEVNATMRAEKLYVFAINANAYDYSIDATTVYECMHDMFGYDGPGPSSDAVAEGAMAIENATETAAAAADVQETKKRKALSDDPNGIDE